MSGEKDPPKIAYYLSTKSGAINGMIAENLREIPTENLNVSLNFVDIFNSRKVLQAFKT